MKLVMEGERSIGGTEKEPFPSWYRFALFRREEGDPPSDDMDVLILAELEKMNMVGYHGGPCEPFAQEPSWRMGTYHILATQFGGWDV